MHTTYVENITAFISNMRPSRSEEQGPVGPVPVITIDGVDYYHKCEFDLEAIEEAAEVINLNLLTAEPVEASSFPRLNASIGYPSMQYTFRLQLGQQQDGQPIWHLIKGSGSTYESRAFTVVDSQEEVTDNTKICLPTCSAYYGFLSEDGNTFISYYNLKGE